MPFPHCIFTAVTWKPSRIKGETNGRNNFTRSTVGTISGLYASLLLFSRIGQPYVGIASSFSFNDPNGMCKTCSGLGKMTKVDVEAILDLDKSWNEGCIRIPSTGPAPGTGSSMRHPACSIWTSLSGRIYKFHIIPGHHFIPLYCLPR